MGDGPSVGVGRITVGSIVGVAVRASPGVLVAVGFRSGVLVGVNNNTC